MFLVLFLEAIVSLKFVCLTCWFVPLCVCLCVSCVCVCSLLASVRVSMNAIPHETPPQPTRSQLEAAAQIYGWKTKDFTDLGSRNRYLAVVCAGDEWMNLCGREWLARSEHSSTFFQHDAVCLSKVSAGARSRGFYVHVIYYGSNEDVFKEIERGADAAFRDKGPKWNLITR